MVNRLSDATFALCLTHDVDRVYQTYQPLYYGMRNLDPAEMLGFWSENNPYWQFENIMEIEEKLGVRSSFYFLNEKHLFEDRPIWELFYPKAWKLFIGRYDIEEDNIRDIIRKLDAGGWEVGLHGSFDSYNDSSRLGREKERLETVLGEQVIGGRQHYLNLERPKTWRIQRDIGLKYDSSLGSSEQFGFEYGYEPLRPFDDGFMVFPLTLMEVTIFGDRTFSEARDSLLELLKEAEENQAVMTVLWHPRFFSMDSYPRYRELYVELIKAAKEMGAWIGDCKTLHEKLTAS